MDGSIGQEKEDLIDVLTLELHHVVLELLEERSKVCWAAKSDLWECLSVCGYHVLNSNDFWLGSVAINSEAVVNAVNTHMAWNTTETEAWEGLVTIIWFKDGTDRPECGLVLVVLSEEMERA
jgi:hypothetical protein